MHATTEQEQVEALKAWWHTQGKKVLIAFGTAFVIWIGWKYWEHHQEVRKAQASEDFFVIMQAVEEDDYGTFQEHAKQLMDQYADTPYASLASLLWANHEIKDPAAAKTHLQWVVDHASDRVFSDIARARLARLLLNEKSYDSAIAMLKKMKTTAFEGLRDEITGDVYTAKGDIDAARAAYTIALKSEIIGGEGRRAFIEMKLNDLGPAPAAKE